MDMRRNEQGLAMVIETHLERSSNAIRNTISLSGLDSDARHMGFKCATNVSLVSLRCDSYSYDTVRAEDWVAIAQIMQLADRLDIPPWRCQD